MIFHGQNITPRLKSPDGTSRYFRISFYPSPQQNPCPYPGTSCPVLPLYSVGENLTCPDCIFHCAYLFHYVRVNFNCYKCKTWAVKLLGLQKLILFFTAGGYGTLEELLEVITWAQLGIHDKPVIPFFLHFCYQLNVKLINFLGLSTYCSCLCAGGIAECRWILQFLAIVHRQGCGRGIC